MVPPPLLYLLPVTHSPRFFRLLTLPRFVFRLLTRYLISEANYGGRVTEAWDRRLVNVYIAQFFCDAALTEGYALSESQHYFIPPDGDLNSVKGFIKSLP